MKYYPASAGNVFERPPYTHPDCSDNDGMTREIPEPLQGRFLSTVWSEFKASLAEGMPGSQSKSPPPAVHIPSDYSGAPGTIDPQPQSATEVVQK